MNKFNKIYNQTPEIIINNQSKFVIMSDHHRGTGDNDDNFNKNENIVLSALNYYYDNDFTYIELGDSDEMWENKNYHDIVTEHLDTFLCLKKFKEKNRLIMIYGNHDICKKNSAIFKKYFSYYFDELTSTKKELLNNLEVNESLILNYNNKKIFLIHGHQGSFLNCNIWKFARFLVRYFWKPLEEIGVNDPTSAAKNNRISKNLEKKLNKWSQENKKILITGHTHRPIFSNSYESLYFNTGSCIHPNGITCIEIENGNITLVKWKIAIKEKNILGITREIIKGPKPINSYFKIC